MHPSAWKGCSRNFGLRGFSEVAPGRPRLRRGLGLFRVWSPSRSVVKSSKTRRSVITPLLGPPGSSMPSLIPCREDGPECAWMVPRARHRFVPDSRGRTRGPCAAAPVAPSGLASKHTTLATQSPIWARQRPPVWGMRPGPPRYYNRVRFKPERPPQPPPRDGGPAFLLASLRSNSPLGVSA